MKTGDNPEDRLIEVLAAQIQDDEKLIDALGAGLLSVDDLEAWYERRKRSEVRFVQICGPLIEQMRVQGFEKAMNRVPVKHAGRQDSASWNR